MSASQRPGLGFVHIERKPIPFIIISNTVKTNVCSHQLLDTMSMASGGGWRGCYLLDHGSAPPSHAEPGHGRCLSPQIGYSIYKL